MAIGADREGHFREAACELSMKRGVIEWLKRPSILSSLILKNLSRARVPDGLLVTALLCGVPLACHAYSLASCEILIFTTTLTGMYYSGGQKRKSRLSEINFQGHTVADGKATFKLSLSLNVHVLSTVPYTAVCTS